MRILALQLKRIGDLILTTPALAALGAWAPETHVTLAVHESTAGLLPALPQIGSGIVLGPGRGWTPWQQTLTGAFDAVLDFTGSDRASLLAALTRAPRRVAFAHLRRHRLRALPFNEFVPSSVRERHTADHYLALSGAPGPGEPSLRLPPGAAERARALVEDRPYALLHAGTARLEKYWVAERWAAVAEHCRGLGLRPVLTGGRDPFEQQHLASIALGVPGPVLNLAGQVDLLTLAALVAGARVVVSVDTAVVHLAAAFRRPQVALFGPTNPAHWRPRHPAAAVLSAAHPEGPLLKFPPRMKGAPMERLSTATVIRATDAILSLPHGQR